MGASFQLQTVKYHVTGVDVNGKPFDVMVYVNKHGICYEKIVEAVEKRIGAKVAETYKMDWMGI